VEKRGNWFWKMTKSFKYSNVAMDDDSRRKERQARARASSLRVHHKKMVNVAAFIRGMTVPKAETYLKLVLKRQRGIPFKQHRAGCGRHAQGKIVKAPGDQVGWPEKPVRAMLDLLENLKGNAQRGALDLNQLYIRHAQVNHAVKMRRRTYRAHGRINPYMRNPCHVELIAELKGEPVEKEKAGAKIVTRKQLAKNRLSGKKKLIPVGGGIEENKE